MTKFIYKGKTLSGVTLNDKGKQTEITLMPGSEYDLPEDNKYIKVLKAKKLLVLVSETVKEPEKAKEMKLKGGKNGS